MSLFFPSFYISLSFDFHFPLSSSLFSGHLTCKPPLVSEGKFSDQLLKIVDFSLEASEELLRQPGHKQLLSHLDATAAFKILYKSISHTPAQGVGLALGVHVDLNLPV